MTTLAVGIGCRSGSTAAQIEAAVRAALGSTFALDQIGVIASIDTKAAEAGLLDFCAAHALPLRLFSREQMAAMPSSERVCAAAREHLGVDGVCEPCALLAASCIDSRHARAAARLIVPKRIHDGVTVAIASPFHDNLDLT